MQIAGYVSASEGQEVTEVTGVGRTPNVSESAKMQVQLETSHVLPVCLTNKAAVTLLSCAHLGLSRVTLCEQPGSN